MAKYPSVKALFESLKDSGCQIKAPIDVENIAKCLNINIVEKVDPQIVGKIEIKEDKPLIVINPIENSYEPRRRFTIAHEIAHYCLHSDKNDQFVDTRKSMSRKGSYWDTYEFEANNFAAQLLMPKELIMKAANRIIDDFKTEYHAKVPHHYFVDTMAGKFNVSSPAMEYRLKNIGIL